MVRASSPLVGWPRPSHGESVVALLNDHAAEATVEMWTSRNGLDWAPVVLPDFGLKPGVYFGLYLLTPGDTIALQLDLEETAVIWTSRADATWDRLDLPIFGNFSQTSFGWVVADPELGVFYSTDLKEWTRLESLPLGSADEFDGTASASASGDAIFLYRSSDGGPASLWVGRFP